MLTRTTVAARLGRQGDLDRAIADYTQAIQLNPKYAPAYYNRGSAWGNKGDFDRAIADYSQAILLDPKEPKPITTAALRWRRNAVCKRHWPTSKCTPNSLHPTGRPNGVKRVTKQLTQGDGAALTGLDVWKWPLADAQLCESDVRFPG